MKKSTVIFLLSLFTVLLFCLAGCDEQSFTLKYEAGEGGYIEGASAQTVQAGTSGEAVRAVPNEGYEFAKWSDGSTQIRRFENNVQKNYVLKAEFQRKTCIVRYLTDGNGTIEGNAEQNIKYGGYGETVKVKANAGYYFVKWSDGNPNMSRQENDVRGSFSVTAIFEPSKLTISYSAGEGGEIEGPTSQKVNRGEDGIPVSATASEGYEFVQWSDGSTEESRQETGVTSSVYFQAEFRKKQFTVRYNTEGGGTLSYKFNYNKDDRKSSQGESGFALMGKYGDKIYVAAEDGEDCHFLYWSDGSYLRERCDMITENLEYLAYFGYTVQYKVYGSGGKIVGKTSQEIVRNQTGESVTAIPDPGYIFVGWSDFSLSPVHETKDLLIKDVQLYAFFEPVEKTFTYDFGGMTGAPLQTTVKIEHDNFKNATFLVPERAGYTFCGWYADEEYRQKVADETGLPMLGLAAFNLETDTLYAKWEKEGQTREIPVYKILYTFVTEIHAPNLNPSDNGYLDHYIMSGYERRMFPLVITRVSKLINEWFEGKVEFEVDTYFTSEPIDENELTYRTHYELNNLGEKRARDFWSMPNGIPELRRFLGDYHSFVELYWLRISSDSTYREKSVTAERYMFSNLEEYFAGRKERYDYIYGSYFAGRPDPYDPYWGLGDDIFDSTYIGDHVRVDSHTFLHEMLEGIIETAVKACEDSGRKMYPFNAAYLDEKNHASYLDCYRMYLLGELETVKGEIVGIPMAYWRQEVLSDEGGGLQ